MYREVASGLAGAVLWRGSGPAVGDTLRVLLARILRMQRALVLVRSGRPPARVAVDAGYADQAHLSREIRSLAGVALGALRG